MLKLFDSMFRDGKKSIMTLDKDAWYKSEGLAMIILYANGNMGGQFS